MYSLAEIWEQAKADYHGVLTRLPRGEAVIGNAAKIQKFKDNYEILNIHKGGSHYKECSQTEYEYFLKYGWKKGIVLLNMSNYLFKLSLIEEKIKDEINTRKNDKHIQHLKKRREFLMNKYSQLKKSIT
jgi:hypothetical protein